MADRKCNSLPTYPFREEQCKTMLLPNDILLYPPSLKNDISSMFIIYPCLWIACLELSVAVLGRCLTKNTKPAAASRMSPYHNVSNSGTSR